MASAADGPGGPLALDDLRVVELAHPATAYAGKLLADLGADVIRVEPPAGSAERRLGPFHHDIVHPERGLPYLLLNTNKRGVTLNLDTADGRALFQWLVATADILIEGERPGQMAAWGLDYDALAAEHPALVMASITGFGQDGPYSQYLAPDFIAFAIGGLMYLSGEGHRPPVTAPCAQAYLVGSLHTAVSVLTALWGRRATGRGDYADVSIQACLAAQENLLANRYGQGRIRREGSQHRMATPGRVYPAADGFVHIFASVGTNHWKQVQAWLEHPAELDDPALDDIRVRRAQVERVDDVVRDFARTRSRAQLYAEGQAHHLPTAPVYAPGEAVETPQFRARGFMVECEHPVVGRLRLPGAPYQLGVTPWRLRRAPPLLGQHNAEVFAELGISGAELTALRGAGAL